MEIRGREVSGYQHIDPRTNAPFASIEQYRDIESLNHRQLIELRQTEPAVAHGDIVMMLAGHERIHAFTRRHEGLELLVHRRA